MMRVETRGESPSPGLLRHPTSPRIRLRPKAGFGGQERGEVNRMLGPTDSTKDHRALAPGPRLFHQSRRGERARDHRADVDTAAAWFLFRRFRTRLKRRQG